MNTARALLVLLLLLPAATARAGDDDPSASDDERTKAAKAHYIAGAALYKLGSFEKAAEEFLAANESLPKIQFLLNAGNCYRNLGNFRRAIELYEQYLAGAPAGDPLRPTVKAAVGELRVKLAAQESVVQSTRPTPLADDPKLTAPPASTSPTAATSRPTAATSSSTAAATSSPPPAAADREATPSALVSRPAPPPRATKKRAWLWGVVAGGVAAIGLGVGLGVGLGAHPSPASPSVSVVF